MALATNDDVQARLGRDLTPSELVEVPGLLDEASDLVTSHLFPKDIPDPVPATIARVTSRMVARVLETSNDQIGVSNQQDTAGPYQRSLTFTPDSRNGGPWLTKSDKISLRPYKLGAFSVRTW